MVSFSFATNGRTWVFGFGPLGLGHERKRATAIFSQKESYSGTIPGWEKKSVTAPSTPREPLRGSSLPLARRKEASSSRRRWRKAFRRERKRGQRARTLHLTPAHSGEKEGGGGLQLNSLYTGEKRCAFSFPGKKRRALGPYLPHEKGGKKKKAYQRGRPCEREIKREDRITTTHYHLREGERRSSQFVQLRKKRRLTFSYHQYLTNQEKEGGREMRVAARGWGGKKATGFGGSRRASSLWREEGGRGKKRKKMGELPSARLRKREKEGNVETSTNSFTRKKGGERVAKAFFNRPKAENSVRHALRPREGGEKRKKNEGEHTCPSRAR